jgi:hypothetical protein
VGKLVNIESQSARIFRVVREVSLDVIRTAIQEAVHDLEALEVVKKICPTFRFEDGSTVDDEIAAKQTRIRELNLDLRGER